MGGIALLACSSWLTIPLRPVPLTLQTLAVLSIGAVLGWRLGLATIAAWLALGAAGLPVLAGGASGLARFAGPTAGFLLAFPAAGALAGWLAERGWGRTFPRALALMLVGHAACLLTGTAWLATRVGPAAALAGGLTPFLLGAVVKSLLGAALIPCFMGKEMRT